MAAPNGTLPTQAKRPLAATYALAVVVISLALVGLAGYSVLQQRHRFDEDAAAAARNTAGLLESTIGEALAKSDLTLTVVAAQLVQRPGWAEQPDAMLEALIETVQTAEPELEHLRVIDAQGFARLGRGVPRESPVSFADREYFQYARDHAQAGLVISRPTLGRITGKWSVALSRRFTTPDGQFGGIVSAIWSVDSFAKLMRGIALGEHGEASLLHRDMSLIYRAPHVPAATRYGSRDAPAALAGLIDRNTAEAE